MADDLVERVLALQQKSDELNSKGQTLRAAEKCGRGADLALASGAPEDSLIVVGMQARQGGFLLSHALSSVTGASEDARAPHRASGLRLLAQSSATLQRRRASDTLLEGKCSTMEESWKLALSCSGSTPRSVVTSCELGIFGWLRRPRPGGELHSPGASLSEHLERRDELSTAARLCSSHRGHS